jgi:hypothetical protein
VEYQLVAGESAQCEYCKRGTVDPHVKWLGASRGDDMLRTLHAHIRCMALYAPSTFGAALKAISAPFPDRALYERAWRIRAEALEDRGDLGKRAVLGDALQAIGDPRGELITAQLLDPGQPRIAQLVRENHRIWLDDITRYARAIEIVNGFPTRVEAAGEHLIIDGLGGPVEMIDQPWIEDVMVGTANTRVYGHLLDDDVLRIEVLDPDIVPLIARGPRVHVGCGLYERGFASSVPSVIEACARMPTLRSFAIAHEMLPLLRTSPLFAQLTSLTLVVSGLRDVIPILPALPRDLRVVLSRTAQMQPLIDPPGELVIEGTTLHATGEWIRAGLVAHMPIPVEKLVVIGAPPAALRAETGYAQEYRALPPRMIWLSRS